MKLHGTGVFFNLNALKVLYLNKMISDRGGYPKKNKGKYLIFSDLDMCVCIYVLIYPYPIGVLFLSIKKQKKSKKEALRCLKESQVGIGYIVHYLPQGLKRIDGIFDRIKYKNGCYLDDI